MRRIALVVLVALAGVASARGHKRKGKVVRVERSASSRARIPRLCGSVSPDGTGKFSAQCWGRPIDTDEVGTVYDETGKKGMIRNEVTTGTPDSCGNTYAWSLSTTLIAGTLDTMSYNNYAMFDWDGGDRGRVIINNGQIPVPGNRAGESVMAMFDTDGDETPELIVTYYLCDLGGNPVLQYGQQQGYCMVYYQRNGGLYDSLRTDIVKNCS